MASSFPSLRVRDAHARDIAQILTIASQSITVAQWSQADYEKLFAREVVRRVTLVIEEDCQVLGFIVARPVAEEWEIENIAVNSEARRRGLGSHLLGEFLNRMKNCGGKQVFLEVRESNHAARALYKKWTFTEMGRRQAYYQDPPEDALVLKISFPQMP